MNRACEFSPDRKYRYTLWREWDESKPLAVFVGLNPSTADETQDDPTIRRCIEFSKTWGYGSFCMLNIFSWRETNPSLMMKEKEPIGRDNNFWIMDISQQSAIVVAAWGKHGSFLGRGVFVKNMLQEKIILKCLGKNKDGSPVHPLYQPANAVPIRL